MFSLGKNKVCFDVIVVSKVGYSVAPSVAI